MTKVSAALLGIGWGILGAAVGVGVQKLSRTFELQEPELDQDVTPVDRWLPVVLCTALFAAFAVRLATLPISLRDALTLLVIYSVYVALLVQIFAFDLKHRIIIDWVVGIGSVLAFGLAFVTPYFGEPRWLSALTGAVAAGAVFALIYLVGRGRALGAGDPKLAFFIGMVCGISLQAGNLRAIQALFYGVLIGGLVAVGVLASRRRGLRDYIAYGPWLVLGTWLVLLADPLVRKP